MSTERKQRPVKPIPDPLDPAETIEVERRWLPIAGITAIFSALLLVASFFLQLSASSGIDSDVDRTVSVGQALTTYAAGGAGEGLRGSQAEIISHLGDVWITTAIAGLASGLSVLLAIPILYTLIRGAWRRRPSFPRWFIWAPVVGGVLFGVGSIAAYLYQSSQYHDFSQMAAAAQTNGAAREAIDNVRDNFVAVRVATGLGSLLVAVGLGAAALSAMNAGLLTRVIGAIGVFLAVLFVIPRLLGQGADLLRAFWFVAVGLTLLGRWPGGRPPAWDSGEARPWPSRAQLIEATEREQGGGSKRGGGSDPAPAPKPKSSSGGGKKKRRK